MTDSPEFTVPGSPQVPDLGDALDDLVAFLDRFMYFEKPEQTDAVALWIVGTYVFEAFDVVPYLNPKSSEKRAGKTLLLEAIEMTASKALMTANVSPAALYRIVDSRKPTMLLDEIDVVFPKGRGSDPAKEDLRGLLNAGYRKSAVVFRSNRKGEIEEFSPFCPKALAGIGDLPDTVADRSIVIALQRKPKAAVKERFRRRLIQGDADDIANRLKEATGGLVEVLADTFPALPDELNDREQDTWEPLFAVADFCGGSWPARARGAALELSADAADNTETVGQLLLSDIRDVWQDDETAIPTSVLLERLYRLEESPWADWYGNQFTSRNLANKLRPYGVRSTTVKVDGKAAKGYRHEAFYPVWEGYLGHGTYVKSVTSVTSVTSQGPQGLTPDTYPLPSVTGNVTSGKGNGNATPGNVDTAPIVTEVTQVTPSQEVPRPAAEEWVGIVEQFATLGDIVSFKIDGRDTVAMQSSELGGDTFGIGDTVNISPNGDGCLHATLTLRVVPL